MTKTLEITSCHGCKHIFKGHDGNWCAHDVMDIPTQAKIDDARTIPEWCPLPDAPANPHGYAFSVRRLKNGEILSVRVKPDGGQWMEFFPIIEVPSNPILAEREARWRAQGLRNTPDENAKANAGKGNLAPPIESARPRLSWSRI
jgi:hypothetical protein